MSNKTNQSGILLLFAIVLGAAVYAFMFFGSLMEQTNMSASYGQLAPSSHNSMSRNLKSIASDFSSEENHSNLTGTSLPSFKMGSTSTANNVEASNPDFPSTGVGQVDVQDMNKNTIKSQTNNGGNYAAYVNQSYGIGNVQYISNPQNPTKSDINVMLLLDTHAAEVAMTTQQGSKRATPALAAKKAFATTNISGKEGSKKNWKW
ncbi:MAG: hypothetical protein WCG93_09255 [Paludibacter sp.]